MMKSNILNKTGVVLLLFLFVIQGCVQGQSIHFTCYKKSVCLNEPIQLKRYTLSNADTTFTSNDSGVCYVANVGTYTLYSTEIVTGVESPKVEVTFFGKIADTLQSWALYPVLIVDGKVKNLKIGNWVYCGERCEGYKVDYYNNGQKRVEGKFKKGRPVGELKFYNESGKLKYLEYYNKRGRKLKSEYVKI